MGADLLRFGQSESDQGDTCPQGYIYPSTRQDPVKMGNFFKKMRQKTGSEPAGKRQEGLRAVGAHGGLNSDKVN